MLATRQTSLEYLGKKVDETMSKKTELTGKSGESTVLERSAERVEPGLRSSDGTPPTQLRWQIWWNDCGE